MKGILKNKKEKLSLATYGSLVSAFVGLMLLVPVEIGTAVAYCVQTDKIDEEYLAKNTEIVYQLQKDEIKQLATDYENGEISFPEYSVKLSEIQSERYVKEKTEKLMDADEEYHSALEEKEGLKNVAIGATGVSGGMVVAGITVAIACNAKEQKITKKEREEAAKEWRAKWLGEEEPTEEAEGQENLTDEVENQEKTTDEEETEM